MEWDQYDAPDDGPEELRQPKDPGLPGGYTPAQAAHRDAAPIVAGGARSQGVGAAIGIIGVIGIVVFGIVVFGVVVASSVEQEPDYSGFYECVAEKDPADAGLLSPADLCEIGNDRPPDYEDNYEYDPFGDVGGDYDDPYGNGY